MVDAFMVGEWTVLPELNSLECDGRTVHLEPKVMQVLVTLAEHPGHVASKEHIFHRVWPDTFVSDEVLTRSVSELRKVFEDNPQKPKYIQTIPKGGYRLVAPVVREPTKRADWLAGHWRKLVTVTAIIVLAVMASLYNMRAREHAASKAPITSLAVLPLKNISGDPSQEYFADGMTEEMISRLSMIRGLRVVSRTSVMQFKDTRIAVPQIARALGVDALVEGSVIRDSGRVRIHAQLIRGATDEHFWSETYDRELGDALALESDIAQAIAAKVQVTVTGEERERLVAARQVAPEVYESYLKGQGQFQNSRSQADLEKSLALFEDAIHKDPTFAPAYLGVAEAYDSLGLVFFAHPPQETRPKGMAAARKALELNPDLAEAHVLLAAVYQREWRWRDAEAEFKWALRLRPNDAGAHLGMAMWLLAEGRTE